MALSVSKKLLASSGYLRALSFCNYSGQSFGISSNALHSHVSGCSLFSAESSTLGKMEIRTFGELLYHLEPGCFDEFPSPEEPKHHIILSTKPPKEYLESKWNTLAVRSQVGQYGSEKGNQSFLKPAFLRGWKRG